MGLHRDYDESQSVSDLSFDEDPTDVKHKRQVRRMLEERLEQKRLQQELEDDLEDEFNWDNINT